MSLDPVPLDPSGYGSGLPLPPSSTRYSRATVTITDKMIRCSCNRLLAELAGRPWLIRCPRCKKINSSPEDSPD